MSRIILASMVAAVLAGCSVPAQPVQVEAPVAQPLECVAPIFMEENLHPVTYYVQTVQGGFGGGYYYEIPSAGLSDRLLRVEFSAEWGDHPLYFDRIHLMFDYYQDEAESGPDWSNFEGSSPLQGSFTLRQDLAWGSAKVSIGVPHEYPFDVGAGVAVIDQPIRLTIHEVYAC